MAASYYGLPRTTLDIDFIVQLSSDQLDGFIDVLADFGLEVNKSRVKRQLRTGYNIVSLKDTGSPYRADFIIQAIGRFDRRPGKALGLRSYYQSPDNLILAKLRMIKATRPVERSFKDREDIIEVLASIKVNKRKIIELAQKQSTAEIFKEILEARRQRTEQVDK